MFESEELILKKPKKKFIKSEFNKLNFSPCNIPKKYKTAFNTRQNLNNTVNLTSKERTKFFNKEFNQLKTSVVLNWCKLFTIGIFCTITSYFILAIEFRISFLTKVMYSLPIGVITAIMVYFFTSFKLFITRFDKENIYSAISKELLSKKNQATL